MRTIPSGARSTSTPRRAASVCACWVNSSMACRATITSIVAPTQANSVMITPASEVASTWPASTAGHGTDAGIATR
ncbi:MAG: hypothetical protein IPK33_10235 [Gemmatimonadetes bacterium]|nr:hypothetical protein [Gemmatimonadota bacterium]